MYLGKWNSVGFQLAGVTCCVLLTFEDSSWTSIFTYINIFISAQLTFVVMMVALSDAVIFYGLLPSFIFNIMLSACYLVIINEKDVPGSVIFNSTVNKLGTARQYNLNSWKNAHFVNTLFYVKQNSGEVLLKANVNCAGIQYPNLFNFYIESTASWSHNVNYYCLPLRAHIIGDSCSNRIESSFKRHFGLNSFKNQENLSKETVVFLPDAQKQIYLDKNNSMHASTIVNDSAMSNKKEKLLQPFPEYNNWIQEISVSYAIYSTNNQLCFKKSQIISNLVQLLPETVNRNCLTNFVSVSDFRVMIANRNTDLVASKNICINEPMWKVTLIYKLQCLEMNELNTIYRLKIVFHQHRLNNINFVKRVRRELKNQSPFFEQSLYVTSVLEEAPKGIVITTIQAHDPENSPILYSMTSLIDSRSQSFFRIDLHSGVLTTTTSLDREMMDVHYFQVIAVDDNFPPRSGTTTLQVIVLDCNDNPPVFEAASYDATIREGSPIGTIVTTVRASDNDVGQNSKIEYFIESIIGGGLSNEKKTLEAFSIDSTTGVIAIRSTLDREETEVYSVIVIATDSPKIQSEQKTSTTTVIVTILDENDNYPEFSEKAYNVQIREDIWDNKPITYIKAYDNDKDSNAAIRYAIIGGNAQSQFSIDSLTGEIYLIKPLDFEINQNFRLVIRAQDGGNPSRSNTTQLIVQVVDVNDNSPRFFVTQFQESVLENVPIGYKILRVQAYDADQGTNADIRYNIIEQDDDYPLVIDEMTGWLQTKKELDHEICSNYVFKVIAVDRGVPPRSSTANIIVNIQDINDNDPVFHPKYYEAVISEDLTPGSSIITVTAVDPDENSRIHYDITSGNIRARFGVTVHNGQGIITLTQPLDFKQENRFLLSVSATDPGGRSDTAYVNINITDANNYAPNFDNSPYSATIMEDAPIGTTVIIVSATDEDTGINAQITYSLQDFIELKESIPFAINAQTGAVTTIAILNREVTNSYFLSVKATDGGNPSLSDTTNIEIVVTDVNDNNPSFRVALYQASISEDVSVGSYIIQVSAEDADIGMNGQIIYSLCEKDMQNALFIIDSVSGIIRTYKPLDREHVEKHSIFVVATDKGSPSLSSSVEVVITLEDVNDSPPSFSADKIIMSINENSPIGSIVGNIEADDPDEGANAIVKYSILRGKDSNLFSLITKSTDCGAQLVLMTQVDYESPKKSYELIVRASSPPLKTDVQVVVLVTDVNDNVPILKTFHIIFNNYPGKFPLATIGRIPAYDADVTDKLFYNIISGNNAGFIRLNESSGEMTLSSQLNSNVPMHVSMEVSVSDGMNEVRAEMNLIIRLITDEMLFNSVTIRINGISEETFLSPLLQLFVEALGIIIPCPKDSIVIFSVRNDSDMMKRINVSFSAIRPDIEDEHFYSSEYLKDRVFLNLAILTNLVGVEILPIEDALCAREPCLNFERCQTFLKFGDAPSFMVSDTVLFRPIHPLNTFTCHCPDGFTGTNEHYLCDTEIDLCYSNPCMNTGKCKPREGGFSCLCDDGFFGEKCELSVLNLKPCEKQFCISEFPCLVPEDSRLSSYTPTCGLKSRYFSVHSFMAFDALPFRNKFNITLSFATLEYNGLLFYNGRYNEQSDFISLEIINGHIWFSISLGSAKHSVYLEQVISDGFWHSVQIIYFNRTVTLIIDECFKTIGIKGTLEGILNCVNQTTLQLNKSCSISTAECHRFLDFAGPFQIGGLPVTSDNLQVNSNHFEGCISNMFIDHRFLNFNSFKSENGTIDGCPQKASHCKLEPCQNGGVCTEGWNQYICLCPHGFTGFSCQETTKVSWRFSNNSMLVFSPLLRPIQFPWAFGFSIRTRKKDTFVMQIEIGQNSTLIISLSNGALKCYIGTAEFYFINLFVSDGNWHRIDLNWTISSIKFSIDYNQRTGSRPINFNIQSHYVGKVILGKILDSFFDKSNEATFEGCIHGLRIGGIQNVEDLPLLRKHVEDGCFSKAVCPKKCPKNSNCELSWDEAYCDCLPGYIGPDCISVCTVNPCNSGICHSDPQRFNFYYCECRNSSYFGENCENIVDQPCPSGWWGEKSCGPCKCDIDKGYSGNCDKKTGRCICKDNHYQPLNGSICIPCECYTVGSFQTNCDILTGQCLCRDGVIGRQCDSCTSQYAEITYSGCEVVYDHCPRSYTDSVWWKRTPLGKHAKQNCPRNADGEASRHCDNVSGKWKKPNLFNCTSRALLIFKQHLDKIEKRELELNSFLSIKIVQDLKTGIQIATGVEINKIDEIMMNTDKMRFDNNSNIVKASKLKIFGNDMLIINDILNRVLNFELSLKGLYMSHIQDKNFVNNLVFSANIILCKEYAQEWHQIRVSSNRRPQDLLELFRKYIEHLAESQYDTFGQSFEVVHENMALGLDIIKMEALNANNTSIRNGNKADVTLNEKVSKSQSISIPKYDNYVQNKMKFDKFTKVQLDVEILMNGMSPDNAHYVSGRHAVIAYAQYKEAGTLFPERYDETIFRRWGINIFVASALFSLAVLIPVSRNISDAGYGHLPLDKRLFNEQIRELIQIIPNENSHNVPLEYSSRAYMQEYVKEDTQNTSQIRVAKKLFNNMSIDYYSLEGKLLTSPIKLQILLDLPFSQFGLKLNPQCVRWNQITNSWTRLGCQTEIPNYDIIMREKIFFINCICKIITTYAVIADLSPIDDIIEHSANLQMAVNGAFMSALSVLLVVIILMVLRGAKTNSNRIHEYILITTFIAELLLFIGMQIQKSLVCNEFMCKLIAISLHYSWVAAFAWMTIDCFHLYRMLTEMNDINHGPMCFYFALGFGAPAIVVGLSVGVRVQEYGNHYFCWLSMYEPVIWWLVVPICNMMGVSLYLLLISIKSAFAIENHILGFESIRKFLLLTVMSLPIMGLMLVLTLLVTSKSSQILTILLCIVVLLHAIFCFIGYCLLNQSFHDNIHAIYLSCVGKTLPIVDANSITDDKIGCNDIFKQHELQLKSNSSEAKRHIGISTSSTTSKSTGKTNSSPYRSLKNSSHVSISTVYNSMNDICISFADHHCRKDNQNSSTIKKNLDFVSDCMLASSHSSDDEELKIFKPEAPSRQRKYYHSERNTMDATSLTICQNSKQCPSNACASQWSCDEDTLHSTLEKTQFPTTGTHKIENQSRSSLPDNHFIHSNVNNITNLFDKKSSERILNAKFDAKKDYVDTIGAKSKIDYNSFTKSCDLMNNQDSFSSLNKQRSLENSEEFGYDFPLTAEEDHGQVICSNQPFQELETVNLRSVTHMFSDDTDETAV